MPGWKKSAKCHIHGGQDSRGIQRGNYLSTLKVLIQCSAGEFLAHSDTTTLIPPFTLVKFDQEWGDECQRYMTRRTICIPFPFMKTCDFFFCSLRSVRYVAGSTHLRRQCILVRHYAAECFGLGQCPQIHECNSLRAFSIRIFYNFENQMNTCFFAFDAGIWEGR